MQPLVSSAELEKWLFDYQELALFDVREYGQFGEGHLFYAGNLPYSRLELDVLRLAPNKNIRLVLCDEQGAELSHKAAAKLRALGYLQVYVLDGGIQAWKNSGRELFAGVYVPSKAFGELVEQACHTPRISALQLNNWQQQAQVPVVLDGRPLDEFVKMSIPHASCCPNGELGLRLAEIVKDPTTPVVINCAGRTRSIIGAQTLINLGVSNPIFALENGTQGWLLADLPLDHGKTDAYPAAPTNKQQQQQAARNLAERAGVAFVSDQQVQRWSEDSSRSLFLCDVRTPEEFAAGSLPAAQSTPGGQLVQSTDAFIGVRNARIVLFDSEQVRAPISASWLKQMGHEVYVLEQGTRSQLHLTQPQLTIHPISKIDNPTLAEQLAAKSVQLLDLRSSAAFIKQRVQGAIWTSRVQLASLTQQLAVPLVLLAENAQLASLAAQELSAQQQQTVGWTDSLEHLPLEQGGEPLSDAQRIDYLFFTHDRHTGNKAAAIQYLTWETGLLAQMTAQEKAWFKPLISSPSAPTQLVQAGRDRHNPQPHAVNPAISRLSTVLFDSVEQLEETRALRDSQRVLSYGARGNPTAYALEDVLSELEGAYRTRLFSTGLAAIGQTFLAYLRPQDHVLINDGVYGPVRRLAEQYLQAFAIQYSYYPADASDISPYIQSNTRLVYTEAPSSLLYELADLPALAAQCKAHDILLAVDNTWGSAYLYNPLKLGADISIIALTKYLGGHSDVMLGSVSTTQAAFAALSTMADTFGQTVSPDDAWLVLRGVRSLAARLNLHQSQTLDIASWLEQHPAVSKVHYPALASHAGHQLWQRDFKGANGLLSLELAPQANLKRFVNSLQHFGIGASWGGFESLVMPYDLSSRQFPSTAATQGVRLHIGLEDVQTLKADLAQALTVSQLI